MIVIHTAPVVETENPFVKDFQKARLALLMNLAAMEGLSVKAEKRSATLYGPCNSGSIDIYVPMEGQTAQFKLNHFLSAAIELRMLDALTLDCEEKFEKEWVQSFLRHNKTEEVSSIPG